MKFPSRDHYLGGSIRRRLILSFVLITALAVGSAVAAWYLMRVSETQMDRMLETTLPLVSGTQLLGQEITLFIAVSQELPQLVSKLQHERLVGILEERLARMNDQLLNLEELGAGEEQLRELRGAVAALEQDLVREEGLIEAFLQVQEELGAAVVRLQEQELQFFTVTEPRIAGSYQAFWDQGQEVQEKIKKILAAPAESIDLERVGTLVRLGFDALLTTAAGELRGNHEIIAVTLRAAGILYEAASVGSLERIEELRQRYSELLPAFKRLQLLLANATPENSRVLLSALPIVRAGSAAGSIFDLRAEELRIRGEVKRYNEQALVEADNFSSRVQLLTESYQKEAQRDSERFAREQSRTQGLQILFVVLAIMLSVIIGWYYVGQRLIGRITSLKRAMDQHAMGIEVEIPMQGDDEIAEMANALECFVSQRKTVERALQESLGSLKEAQEIANFGSCLVEGGREDWEWSDGFYRIIGFKPGEIESTRKNFLARVAVADRERVAGFFERISPSVRIHELDFRLLDKAGKERSVTTRWRYTMERGEATNQLHGTVLDITERQHIEEELHKVKKLESVGVLAGGIAHDFNNLLTAIMGNVAIASRQLPQDHSVRQYLELAQGAAVRARDLTKRLLTFAKGGEPIKSLEDLKKLLHESVSFAMHGSKSTCHFELPDDLWPVTIDPGQMSQVLQNIVVNADQAMPGGGVIWIRGANVRLEDDGQAQLMPGTYVKIEISDEGCGISPENLETIFDPYFTTKSLDSTKGSGLGLAIVHSIMRKHGGAVAVDSQIGIGSTFTLWVPAQPEGFLPEADEVREEYHVSGLVLVMDDEEIIRTVSRSMLEHLGYQVETAVDGVEAIRLYRQALERGRPPDAVLADLTVPGGMGGEEMAVELLALDPQARIIVSSGYANNPVMEHYRRYGFCGRVSKPYQLSELSEEMSRVLSAAHPVK